MTFDAAILPWLHDPIVWMVAAALLFCAWSLRGRQQRLRRQRARLRQQVARTSSPRERHALMQQWRALGGAHEQQRVRRLRLARELGQQARAAGRPLSHNPFRHSLWGAGRRWKDGWHSVERNVRWLERKRA